VAETLAYDDLPAGSDLAREFTAHGGVTITAAVREPSARALCWARRRAVPRAVLITALALTGVIVVGALMLRQTGGGLSLRYLPTVIFPLLGVLAAAVFLLAWQVSASRCIDALHESRRQVTIISADPTTLRIQSDGPFGPQSHAIPASRVRDIRLAWSPEADWHSMHRRLLHLKLEDGDVIALLPGRDESELAWVAGTLRRVLAVPQEVVPLR
jgi:hypothetical protein